MASARTTPTAPPLSLEEVLHIFLICFDAAADAYPQAPTAYALPCRDPSIPVEIWRIWSTEDLKTSPPEDLDRFTFLPLGLNDAVARMYMCDCFCLLLEDAVHDKIQELFHGRARWLTYWPKIDFLMEWSGNTNQPLMPLHSVLLVETGDGREMIMDGTLRQFLWEPTTWLQTWEECLATRVDKQEGRKGWTITREDLKIAVEQVAVRLAGGYWCTASERLTNLFQVLNWEKLRSMGMVERTEHVKKMAGERFADFREEGFNFE